jgi:hypothetical protein
MKTSNSIKKKVTTSAGKGSVPRRKKYVFGGIVEKIVRTASKPESHQGFWAC